VLGLGSGTGADVRGTNVLRSVADAAGIDDDDDDDDYDCVGGK